MRIAGRPLQSVGRSERLAPRPARCPSRECGPREHFGTCPTVEQRSWAGCTVASMEGDSSADFRARVRLGQRLRLRPGRQEVESCGRRPQNEKKIECRCGRHLRVGEEGKRWRSGNRISADVAGLARRLDSRGVGDVAETKG